MKITLPTLVISVFVANCPAFSQSMLSPPAPLTPTTYSECDRFQAKVTSFLTALAKQHQSCLDAHQAAKTTDPRSSMTCSVASCQDLHTQLFSDGPSTSYQVTACRQKVKSVLDEKTRQIKQEESDQTAKQEISSQMKDNEARRAHGDYLEQHAAWQARENNRRHQKEELENEVDASGDEAERHATLDRILQEIAKIKTQEKQDPEPKDSKPY